MSINIITEEMKIERFYISEETIHGRKNIISDKNYKKRFANNFMTHEKI